LGSLGDINALLVILEADQPRVERFPAGKAYSCAASRHTKDKLIEDGEIDPSFVVTHPASLEDAPAMYKKYKEDGVIKVMLRPGG
jgi:hypothetical protein